MFIFFFVIGKYTDSINGSRNLTDYKTSFWKRQDDDLSRTLIEGPKSYPVLNTKIFLL